MYPDIGTALFGRWQAGQLISARQARLCSWQEVKGVIVPVLDITCLQLALILDTAYLYPDLRTALVGRWLAGQLISARPARLCSWQEVEGVMVPAFQFTAKTEFR
jgi:hypothetical protein